MARVTFVGEGMVELRQAEGDAYRLGYGGDTLNSAIHMARSGYDVAYATALGNDTFSERLRSAWEDEGLDCSTILTDPAHGAGLYAISLDARGERSFTYWRSDSAARQLFALPRTADMMERVEQSEMLVFSLISLAILPEAGKEALLSLAARMRDNGCLVAFDANYRPRLWDSARSAAHWRDRAIAVATHGLPTLDDEMQLGPAGDADDVAAHWQDLGCAEVVVKLGAEGCRLPDGEILAPASTLDPVDTSGAGDAFNAGYLSARLGGADPREAARKGNALAAWTIMRAGAIPPRDTSAPYPEDP
ncbi:sugar kinase [Aurantiacibacter hainanensis]|uniref:sugar kinase n=1 Tax=Aurantiacibacter hainanensis TaxID=3076114 RepID=UPI0030C72656